MARFRLKYDLENGGPFIIARGAHVPQAEPEAEVLSIGTSSYPITPNVTTTEGGSVTANGFIELYAKTTGWTSGTPRAMYVRLYKDDTLDGEALRVFTTCQGANAGGSVHGAHISINFTDADYLSSGQNNALRATFHLPDDAAIARGTNGVINCEIYSDGASSALGASSNMSFFEVVNGGNATGKGTVDDYAFLFNLSGFTIADGHMVQAYDGAYTLGTSDRAIKVKVGATTYYIPLTAALS